jgi:hypothetical protein
MKRKAKVVTGAFKSKWEELAHLSESGMLKPESVVKFAQSEDTHLHRCFEWNDTKAAEKFRLDQARKQISMYVMVVEGPKGPVQIRAFQSLPSDRREGLGYRKTTDILQDQELIAELVGSAMKDLAVVKQRYEAVAALAPVWAAAEEVHREVTSQSGQKEQRKAA